MYKKVKNDTWGYFPGYVVGMRLADNDVCEQLHSALCAIPDIHTHVLLVDPNQYQIPFLYITAGNMIADKKRYYAWQDKFLRKLSMMQDVLTQLPIEMNNHMQKDTFQVENMISCFCLQQSLSMVVETLDEEDDYMLTALQQKIKKYLYNTSKEPATWRLTYGYWKGMVDVSLLLQIRRVVKKWSAAYNISVHPPLIYTFENMNNFVPIQTLNNVKCKVVGDL